MEHMMETDHGPLDHTLCQQMAELVETLTTSGKPSLDQGTMKQLKKICKISDAYVEHCFQLVISQLQEDHAEVRLSAFQVISELFARSHRFRELLVADMQEYLELTVETNVDLPLPPPKAAAKLLKEQALGAMQEWHTKYSKAYKKLGLGYTYLKNCKMIDFADIQARSDAERQRSEERQRRLQLARTQKLNQVNQEMNEMIPELQECLTQCENCFRLLLPNMASADDNSFEVPSTSISTSTATSSSSQKTDEATADSSGGSVPCKSDVNVKNCKVTDRTTSQSEENSTKNNASAGSSCGSSPSSRKNGTSTGVSSTCSTNWRKTVSSTENSSSSSTNSKKISGSIAISSSSSANSPETTWVVLEESEAKSAAFTQARRSIFDIDDEVEYGASGSGSYQQETSITEKVTSNDENQGHSRPSASIREGKIKDLALDNTGSKVKDDVPAEGDLIEEECRGQPLSRTLESKKRDEDEIDLEENEPEEMEEVEEEEEDTKERDKGENVLQQHGLPSWTSINININLNDDGVVILEDADNTDVLRTLEDQQRLLTSRYLTKLSNWIETLTKLGQSGSKVKQLIDLKGEVKAQQDKFKEMTVKWTLSPRKKTSISSKSGSERRQGSHLEGKMQDRLEDDDDDDDEDDEGFDAVPDKEGYEADIPKELKEEFGLEPRKKATSDECRAGTSKEWHPIRDADMDLLDPASQAGSIAAMKEKLRKIRETANLPPGFHSIPAKKKKKEDLSEEELKRQKLLEKAPVLTFGTDLAYWENPQDIKAPVVLRPDTDARTWISAVDEEEVVLESAKDVLKTRVMSFTGTFKPIKWKCRAPLPNGALCERMDREKCPFHGKIIARDELGNPSDSSRLQGQETGSPNKALQDPELPGGVEGAAGLDPGSSTSSTSGCGAKGSKGKGKGKGKKGKGKARKYPGLTDIRKINNTSRNRLEKIVMNRGSLKRVAAAMSRVDQKKYMDKFGNNFNYAL